MEKWEDIPGYEGLYQASTLGRIRSIDREETLVRNGKKITRRRDGRILRQSMSNGYKFVNLSKDGMCNVTRVHVLVALTFIGPRGHGMTVNHKDLSRTNNRADNLEYVTQKGNIQHAIVNGAIDFRLSLSQDDVVLARKLHMDGATPIELARRFGVCRVAMGNALALRTYSHIPAPKGYSYQAGRALSDKDAIRLVRMRNKQGATLKTLAAEFGINKSMVSRISSGKAYGHLKEQHPELYRE